MSATSTLSSRPETAAATSQVPFYLIKPAEGWRSLDIAELVAYRGLVYSLFVRAIRSRYRQSVLGIGWLMLQPLLTASIYAVVFSLWGRMPTHGLPPVLFHLSGLVPWWLFSTALRESTTSLAADASLIRKVYFPRLLVPLVKVSVALVDFLAGLVILLILLCVFRRAPAPTIVLLPCYVLLAMGLAAGLGLWLSCFHVKYHDVGRLLSSVTQFWMYLSPVIYTSALVPERWKGLYFLNPMAGIINGFRWSLFQVGDRPGPQMLVTVAVVLAVLISGAYFFRSSESTIADVA